MRNVEVNLQVKANTSAAQSNLQQLGKLLKEIGSSEIRISSGPISEAAAAAQQLQIHLQNAVNVNTGKIDLTKLNKSLASSNTNLLSLTTNLRNAGPSGQQAFLKIASAIASAEAPLVRINAGLKNFGITLLNTIKWQIASNMIHGVQSALQGAVSHAKELNAALNDIRIVTGYSTGYMANFAEEARKAAKELSTTTTEYSKAALIFYQQGLTGKDVTERVNTVIKLAQVTGRSAEDISSQMTAIWNNFYDGSKSLEYYADVITKLGANTASSSEEIATGLQKFAAVADTVGLSYEKATAALATVVAETRQSAEIVGTAFKTIFARVEGLNLGETLEDGVSLNKYSKALATVGVNVLDINGQLKSMDTILDQLGDKWALISDSQKVALAQTVAGQRQYAQFMALMNNYDKIQANEVLAHNADNSLAEQAKIWSESWEAASQRVKKSTQDLYEQILNDEALIKFEDFFNSIINGINHFVKSAGGIAPVFLSIIGMLSGSLFPLIQSGFRSISNNIQIMTGKAAQDFAVMSGSMSAQITEMLDKNTTLSDAEKQQIQITQQLIDQKTLLTLQSKTMTQAEKLEAQQKIQLLELSHSLAMAALDRQIAAEKELKTLKQLTDAEEQYQIAAANKISGTRKGSSEEQIYREAATRGRDLNITKTNIDNLTTQQNENTEKAQQEIAALNKEKRALTKQAKTTDDEEVLEKINNKLIEIEQRKKEINKATQAENQSLKEQLEKEEQILSAQKNIRGSKVNSSTSVGVVNVDDNYQNQSQTITNMLDNTLSQQGFGLDGGQIQATIDNYQQLITAETEARMAAEDFQAIQQELATIETNNKDAIANLTAQEIERVQAKQATLQAAKAQAQVENKNANTARKNVATLNDEIAALKQNKASTQDLQKKKEELKAAEKDLATATDKEANAQKNLKIATNDLSSSTTTTQRFFANLAGTIDSMCSKLNMSDEDLKSFQDRLKEAFNAETPEEKIKQIQQILEELSNSSDEAGQAFSSMAADMGRALTNGGVTPERLLQIANSARQQAQSSHEASNATREHGDSLDRLNAKSAQASLSLSTIASIAGKTAMAINALKNIARIWDDKDVGIMEKVTTILMSIGMLIPALTGKYSLLKVAKLANLLITSAQNKESKKAIKAFATEQAKIGEETGAWWANTAAAVANFIAKNGWAGAIAGAFILAVIGATVAIIAHTAATEKNTKATIANNQKAMESAEAATKAGDAWLEQTQAMDVLIAKYKVLNKEQEDYLTTQKEIIDSVPDLVKSYEDLADSLHLDSEQQKTYERLLEHLKNAAALGSVEDIEKAKEALDELLNKTLSEETKAGATAAVSNLQLAMQKETGGSTSGNIYKAKFDGSASQNYNEEKLAQNILQSQLGDKLSTSEDFWGRNVAEIDFNTKDTDEFLATYEQMQQAKIQMDNEMSAEARKHSDIYRELTDLLDATKEDYETAKEFQGEIEKFNVTNFSRQTDIKTTDVHSYADYEKYKKNLIDLVEEEAKSKGQDVEAAKKATQSWLEANEVLTEYVKQERVLTAIQDKYGYTVGKTIKDQFNNLSDEEKTLFLQIDFNHVATTKAVETEIARLQEEANREKIYTQIQGLSTAESKLKETGMSAEDWQAIESSIDWDQQAISFQDFLSMTYAQQKNFLTKTKNDLSDAYSESVKTSLQQAKDALPALEEDVAKAQAELFRLQDAAFEDPSLTLETYEELIKPATLLLETAKENLAIKQEEIEALENQEAIEDRLAEDRIREKVSVAEDLIALNNAIQEANEAGIDVPYSILSDALIRLGESYESCSGEVLNYQQAMASGSDVLIQQAEAALRNAIYIGEMSNALDLSADAVEEQTRILKKDVEALKDDTETARRAAIINQSMNKGVTELSKNWSTWKETLTTVDHRTQDYADTVLELRTTLASLLGVTDKDFIPDDFLEVEGVMENLDAAAEGDVNAINAIGLAMADATIQGLQYAEGMQGINLRTQNAWDMSAEAFGLLKNEVLEGVQNLTEAVTNGTVQAGDDITKLMNGTGMSWVNSLNEMAYATGMSVDEMNSMLNELGVQADVTTTTKTIKTKVPIYRTEEKIIDNGEDSGLRVTETSSRIIDYQDMDSSIEVAQINMGDSAGTPPTVTYAGRAPAAPSTTSTKGGGGGGSKTSAAQHKHSVNRYSNEENLVKGISDDYDRLSTAKDHAFGADKLNRMEKELRTLRELKDATTAYLGAIVGNENADKFAKAVYEGKNIGKMIAAGELGGTLAADYASLFSGKDASGKNLEYQIKDAAGNAKMMEEEFNLGAMNSLLGGNLAVQLDAFGRIYNRDALLDELDRLYNNEEDRWQEISASASEADENEHTRRQAMIEAFRERLDQYEETRDLSMDKVNEWLDYIYQIQQVNADKIAYKLEVQTKLMDNELTAIQNAVKVLGNTIYRDVDAMRNWYDKNITQRGATRAANAAVAEQTMADAWEKWQAWTENELDDTGINSEQALELFDQARDAIQGAFDDIFDRISEMESLFGDTLDYWNEKIERVTSAIEANANTLDHLQNVLGLLGRGTDYRALGTILKGQLDNARGSYDVAAARAASSTDAYNDALAFYATLHGEEAEFYKANVLDKMEDQMRADVAAKEAALENVLEKVNAWFENEVNRIYQESEDRLTGDWGSFDALDAAMQRQHNLADEYLTKTNQLYETNDLLRKLSQDLDKTDSVAAKAKIKAFSDEIELMKQQEKLSKTDLEIAKARYEVLLAQIALEEAQNAKSVVRLQRDNEGNYGYVYTADQDKVADAEKNLADKQNDLYNLVLNQTQDYTEKILQHTRERNEALKELDMQGITDQEEYNKQRQDIIEKYNALIEADYQSYYTAVKWLNQVGAEGQTEAWTNSFTDILYSQDEFGTALAEETEAITQEVNEDMDWLNEQREFYTEEAKVGNEELKDSVKKITDATDDLVHKLTDSDGLIKGMSNATKTADELNRKFSEQYGILMNAARGYETLLGQIDNYYTTVAGYERDLGESDHTEVTEANNGGTGAAGEESGGNEQSVSSGSGGSYARVAEVYNLINSGAVPSGAGRKEALLAKGFSETEINAGQRAINLVYVNGYSLQKAINQALEEYAGQFDTGGYTGDWGPGGKLAFLHEKELVLNKEDTKNLLDAVNIIREISSAIDLRTAAAYRANGLNSPYYEAGVQQIEQTVTIHAEFPNVEDHNEIEEAFNNLINRASQFANRQ